MFKPYPHFAVFVKVLGYSVAEQERVRISMQILIHTVSQRPSSLHAMKQTSPKKQNLASKKCKKTYYFFVNILLVAHLNRYCFFCISPFHTLLWYNSTLLYSMQPSYFSLDFGIFSSLNSEDRKTKKKSHFNLTFFSDSHFPFTMLFKRLCL